MKRAFIFPGQGAQYVGMGKDFFDAFASAKYTFQEADDLLKSNLSKIIFEGPEDLLTLTKNSQLAIFVVSAAILRSAGMEACVCSGLSLGEYTALFASKRLDFASTLRLIEKRSAFMNEACEQTRGAMAAVLGLSAAEIASSVNEIEGAWVANYNAPGQTVISGTEEGIVAATALLKEKGARKVIRLNVHGAFHSGLMSSAQNCLTPFIQAAPIQESEIGFVMNVPGDYVWDVSSIKNHLSSQVTQSVRWEQGIESMKASGVTSFIEIGCGKTLSSLNKKMGAPTLSIEKVTDLEAVHALA